MTLPIYPLGDHRVVGHGSKIKMQTEAPPTLLWRLETAGGKVAELGRLPDDGESPLSAAQSVLDAGLEEPEPGPEPEAAKAEEPAPPTQEEVNAAVRELMRVVALCPAIHSVSIESDGTCHVEQMQLQRITIPPQGAEGG